MSNRYASAGNAGECCTSTAVTARRARRSGPHHERLHARHGEVDLGAIEAPIVAICDAEVDRDVVGMVHLAAEPDLVDAHVIDVVVAPLAEDAGVDVHPEGTVEVVDHATDARGRIVGEPRRVHRIVVRGERWPGRAGPVEVERGGGPAALEDVGQVHHVVGVEMRDVRRLDHRAPSPHRRVAVSPARQSWRCTPSPQSTR